MFWPDVLSQTQPAADREAPCPELGSSSAQLYGPSVDSMRTRRALTSPTEPTPAAMRQRGGNSSLTRRPHGENARALLATESTLRGGRYVIRGVVGKGGEGVVYRAFDTLRNDEVALKVLHLEDLAGIPLLKREFRFLRDLIHPHLVQLHELVVERELSFFTMSHVEGVDFLTAAKGESELRSLILQLSDVLSFLHQGGRVHRDVKPSNIVVRPGGHLVLLDFGIGLDLRRVAHASTLPVGTPRYMAPEVLKMQGATAKSDAYSLGILIYEALTGQHPCPSGRTELAQERAFDPRDVRPDAPADLSQLVLALTTPQPELRADVASLREFVGVSDHDSSSPNPLRSERDSASSFAGRLGVLSRIHEAYERMREGHEPVVVCVEASSGMGKSSLVERFIAEQAFVAQQQSATPNRASASPRLGSAEQTTCHLPPLVLRSRCSEHELLPHKAIDGIVEGVVDYLLAEPAESRLELLPEPDAQVLLQLFPELYRVPEISHHAHAPSAQGDYRALRVRSYQALAALLARLAARRPLVVVIDDLQWGDVDSGKLLYEVFGGAQRPVCLLLLAYRSEEKTTSACLRELLQRVPSFTDDVLATTVQLGPLSRAESTHLLRKLLPHSGDAVTARIAQESGGSPLLLTEMAAHAQQQGSVVEGSASIAVLDGIVDARVRAVSSAARQAFYLLCCTARQTEVALLADLCGERNHELVVQLESARLARARSGGLTLEILHDALRAAGLRNLGEGAAAYHAKLAEALVAREADPGEIARHYLGCADPRASEWAQRAAELASQSFALERAVELYRLALTDAEAGTKRQLLLQEKLADALADSGRGAEAAPLYAQLADQAELDHAIELRRRAAEQWLVTGDAQRGTSALEQVQYDAGLVWPKTTSAALRQVVYQRARLLFIGDGALRVSEKSRDTVALKRKLAASRAAWPISMISTIHGAANSGMYLRLALKAGEPEQLAVGCAMEAMYHATAGPSKKSATTRWMGHALRCLPETASGHGRAFMIFAHGQIEYLLGDFAASIKFYAEAEAAFLRHGRNVAWELNSGRLFWSDALFYLGQHRELDRRFAAWIADAQERGDRYLLSALLMARAVRTVLRDGTLEEARAEVQQGEQLWNAPYVSYHHISAAVTRACIDIYAGCPQAALARFAEVHVAMKKSYLDRVHVARVQVGRVEGLAHLECAADAPLSERPRHLRRARQISRMLQAQGSAWATAWGLQFEAIARLMERPDERALSSLQEAGKLFSAVGMGLHAAAVDARYGELVGGDTGRVLLDNAYARLQSVDFTDWVSALSLHTPRVLAR